uniref:Sestrin-3 n=1 Tax=Macrostomum lignano TaxID=282301 RepID=A0A1I8FWT7_9PLAT
MTANGTASEPFLPVGRSPESISMLRGLSDRESNNRSDIFSQCRSMFQVWYFGLSSPPNLSDMQYLGGAAAAGRAGDPSQRCNIEEQLPDLLRISKAAPLPDAREKATELLDFVETNLHMRLPRPRYAADFAASEFIPQRELIPLDETLSNGEASASASRATFSNHFDYEDDELAETGSSSHDLDAELIERSQDLLLDQFHEWHRSCNMFHVMAYHPEYLDIFLRFHNCLLRSAGPVGYAERHYLALMAASRHRCAYLAHLHAAEFIHLNGDESWLRGLEHASSKMQKLGQLCRLVAHRPWEITSDILRPLLTGADSLSQSELVHCMCILAHFTALAGFDYSWEEDGCCLVDRYLPSIGYELNERFETSFNLTYLTMGMNTNVETAPFRRAVWYYVHSIFGIRHDDYDYHLINRMLSIELKKYCKLVACAPEQVTMGHYRSAMPGFKHSEKVHVNLVIMDARVQACLLYSLRALNDHTTGQ